MFQERYLRIRRATFHDLLEVVEYQQRRDARRCSEQSYSPDPDLPTDRDNFIGDSGRDNLRVADPGEGNKPDCVRGTFEASARSQRQAALPGAACAPERVTCRDEVTV